MERRKEIRVGTYLRITATSVASAIPVVSQFRGAGASPREQRMNVRQEKAWVAQIAGMPASNAPGYFSYTFCPLEMVRFDDIAFMTWRLLGPGSYRLANVRVSGISHSAFIRIMRQSMRPVNGWRASISDTIPVLRGYKDAEEAEADDFSLSGFFYVWPDGSVEFPLDVTEVRQRLDPIWMLSSLDREEEA